ncbi:DUF2267 domain-containing protein [Streptomyces sp. NPDC047002]|uniref:DUF2267 domain-containing protein n=1 Tax=Streptomyces sp. NPDC047002 TaxID=3155475 RepID=UPI00345246B9
MQYDELIGHVQAGAALPDRGAATRVTRAVLATLAERLPDGTARHLFAQLPADLVALVEGPEAAGPDVSPDGSAAERFDLPTFVGRVAWRAEADEDAAVEYVGAVFEALDAAVAPELMKKVTDALPRDIGSLLPTARVADPGR